MRRVSLYLGVLCPPSRYLPELPHYSGLVPAGTQGGEGPPFLQTGKETQRGCSLLFCRLFPSLLRILHRAASGQPRGPRIRGELKPTRLVFYGNTAGPRTSSVRAPRARKWCLRAQPRTDLDNLCIEPARLPRPPTYKLAFTFALAPLCANPALPFQCF